MFKNSVDLLKATLTHHISYLRYADGAAWRFGSVCIVVVASDRHSADPLHTHTHACTRMVYLSMGLTVPPAKSKTG
jgi:hypothetical protein